MEDGSRFKVIIVGGSIAGLSLAHCLHKAGIKCIVLEKRSTISIQEGASIAVLPNGGRILEQLGLYDAVEELIEPMHIAQVRLPDGFQFSNSYPKTLHQTYVPTICTNVLLPNGFCLHQLRVPNGISWSAGATPDSVSNPPRKVERIRGQHCRPR